jgi:hypothetical protein
LSGANGGNAIKSSGVKPELLVSAMVAVFVFGLIAIGVLLGVMKRVADFDLPILLAVTMLSFVLMLVVEGVLIWLLLSGRRGLKAAGDTEGLKEQTTKELGESQARALPQPAPSVTEHTTRAFEPIYSERKSK